MVSIPRPKQDRRLPVVLSHEVVRLIFNNVICLKQKALLMVAYDTGLRLSELIHLRIENIDSQRMVIRVRQGKSKKDRYARLACRTDCDQFRDSRINSRSSSSSLSCIVSQNAAMITGGHRRCRRRAGIDGGSFGLSKVAGLLYRC
jgi:site-specific recombinase XerD